MKKFAELLKSRKFWATIGSLTLIAGLFFTGQIDPGQAVNAIIAALGAYVVGTGISDSGK